MSAPNKIMNLETSKAVVKIGRGDLISALSIIRNKILDWSIEMEKQGVLGKGLSFDNKEKEKAKVMMNTYNIGEIRNFKGNIGSQTNATVTDLSNNVFNEIKELSEKISNNIPLMDLSDSQIDSLSQKISLMKTEAEQINPDSTKLKDLMKDVKTIMTGAAGNLTAQGAISLITSILSKL